MPVTYKLYQEKRKASANKDKWYARAIHPGIVTTDDLAKIMQNNCTLKRSDILAVLSELVDTMKTQLQNSMRVKLNGFGTFKIGLSTKPAKTARDFNPASNIVGTHVLFLPEVKIDAKHKRTRAFLDGLKVREATVYDVVKPKRAGGKAAGASH